MINKKQIVAFSLFFILSGLQSYAQVSIASAIGLTPLQLVQNFLVGNGVVVSNVKFNDSPNTILLSNQIGSFSTGLPTNLGITTGITISTGGVQVAVNGMREVGITGTQLTVDPQLQSLKPGKSLRDIARLEFDFIPSSDTIKFRYVFASNEYPTAVCSVYDDVFGFFISGLNPNGGNYVNQNIALIPGTNIPVSINTVNGGVSGGGGANPCYLNYTQYFHIPSQNITYNGATVPLTAWARVVPCSTYHIKLAICDVSNTIYDSGVFLEANSFTSPKVLVSHSFTNTTASDTFMIRGCNNAIVKLKLPHRFNFNYAVPILKQGTAINGVDFPAIPDTIFIPANTDSVLFTIVPFQNATFTVPKLLKLLIKTSVCSYDTLMINILPNLPLIAKTIIDTAICKNSNVELIVTGSGGLLPYLFTWNNGDTNTHRTVSPVVSTMYNVMLKDKCDQTAKDSVLITVHPDFSIAVSANPTIICPGEWVQLNVLGAQKYLWKSSQPDPSLQSQDTLNNPLVKPVKSTIYRVTGFDGFGCTAIDSIQITIHPLLNASIIANPNPVSIIEPTVHFIDGSSGATSWLWNTGDGFTTNVRDFYHTYSNLITKNYNVTLIISNASGCIDSAHLEIVIYPELKIYIPNAFTPGSNGFNSVFKAVGEGLVGFEMFIYNRWGQMVFSSQNINNGWDGKYQNEEAIAGVYVYTVNYKDFTGKTFNKTGTLNLIR